MDIQDIISGISSGEGLQAAAEKAGIDPSQAPQMLQAVLDHVHGGGALEEAANAVAAKTGFDPSQVEQFLPHVAGLLQGHADNAPGSDQGVIGNLMGMFKLG
jgi:hypothetical protein